MSDEEKQFMRTSDPAAAATNARSRSESATLAVAVMFAVTVGVGFGMWIMARLPPPPSAVAPASARLLPDAHVSAPPAPAVEPSPAHVPADSGAEARPTTDSVATPVKAREATPDAGAEPARANAVAAAVNAEPQGVTNSEPAAPATPDSSRPMAWQVGPLPKAGGRALAQGNFGQGAATQDRERSSERGAQAPPGPCALYASASALSLRIGGAAPLILGGPGQGVRINVSTPDWSEIAIIYEGPAGGRNGWLKYSVRSLGRRPGLYTMHFSTPCGSQTIPITVR